MSCYHAHSDEQLLRCLQNGDEPAFDELYNRYWRVLYDAACKRLGDSRQAEDIVQEVFITLWTRRENLNIDHIAAYLHTAVRYSILSYFTRHKPATAFFEPFEAILKATETPEQEIMAKEMLELAFAYAATLSDRKKQILMLHLKGSKSTKEIAEMLGITQKTVQNQLGSALQGLRKSLIPAIITFVTLHF